MQLARPEFGEGPADWFDPDSSMAVDWRRSQIIWCQRSRRRIMTARFHIDYPVLTLVKDTLCTGLTLDLIGGDVYWTSASGHLVFRASYVRYNATYARETHEQPVYILTKPDHSISVHNNQSVETVVTAHGLAGDFGKSPSTMPVLLSVTGEDPDDGDAEFGNGDRLLIQFDRPTNVSETIIEDGEQPQAYVDSLFTVSHPLGHMYSGIWLDTSTFRIDVQNAWLPRPQINGTIYTTKVWLPSTSPLMSVDESMSAVTGERLAAIRLTGSLGSHAKPRLISVVGADPDNGDDVFGTGDTITLKWDVATYIGRQGSQGSTDRFRSDAGSATELSAAGVDALFRFDFYLPDVAASRVPSFGLDYKGAWTDDSTFVITIVNGIRRVGRDDKGRIWSRMPLINDAGYMDNNYQGVDSIWVDVLGDVRSLGLQSPRCTDRVPLTGNWGTRTQKPLLSKIYGIDPDNGDALPSPGDTLTLVFDRRTSKGRTARPPPPESGTKSYADFFLRFEPSIGTDYTARFTDDSTFVLTVNSGNPEWAQGGTISIQPSAQIKNSAATSDPASEDFELPAGIWGNPGAPKLVSAKVHDYDNFNTAWSGQDVIRLAFDRSTNHGKIGKAGGKAYVDSLFAFDHWLGDDYSGYWSDLSTFSITAIDVNVQRPAVGRTSVTSSKQILNLAATATCCTGHAQISGSFGAAAKVPKLVAFSASDPASETDGPTAGEIARLVFDVAVALAPGKTLGDVFTFTPPLPPDALLRQAGPATFEVVVGPSGAGTDGDSFVIGGTNVRLHAGTVRNARLAAAFAGQPSPLETHATETVMALSGSFGSSAPPKLVSFVPSDPANADEHFSDGDQLTLRFDVYTDQSGALSTKAAVDSIFGFSSSLGSDYTGEWSECYDEQLQCRTFTITIVDAAFPLETDTPPVIGSTLAWVKPPDPDSSDQPLNWQGVLSASKISKHSTAAIALGASEHSDAEPMAPALDLGRDRILFLQRTAQPAGATPIPYDVVVAQSSAADAAASLATAEAANVVHGGKVEQNHRRQQYGAANGLSVRICSVLRSRQAHIFEGGLRLSLGSCNRSGAIPPFHLTSGYFVGDGCSEGGFGCGVSVQLSTALAQLARPSGAPIGGNTSINILGTDLSSVRMVQFWVDGMRYGEGLSPVRPFDAGGFSCVVPAFNATLIQGYDRGAVSQEITVRLSEDGQRFVDAGISFVYYREPLLTGVHPLGGPIAGATVVFHGAGLHAVHADPSAARCRIGGVITPVRAIAATGETLTCVLPPLPPGFVVGAKYSISVAIDGTSFIESVHGSGFSYYLPPATATIQPISGDSEAQVEVSMRVNGLDNYEGGERRCRFGVAGSSAAYTTKIPSADPLRPELSQIELRCRAPPCMQWGCLGTVEVTLALNGMDYTGFSPPLLFQYRNEFSMHVWGCDGTALASNDSKACGTAVIQRATALSSKQLNLAVERAALEEALDREAKPARIAADALLSAREADRHSTSWQLRQARRDAHIAATREREVEQALNRTATELADWSKETTVARISLTTRSHLELDALDKRVYWISEGALFRARFGPNAVVSSPQKLLELGPAPAGLVLHRVSGRLYWTAQGRNGGYEVRRADLDGSNEELLLADMPMQTRVHAGAISADGTLSTAYVGVSQPGNASLLLIVEQKALAMDANPLNHTLVTLLRGVAPTALVQYGRHFYYTVAVAQAIRRCELDGSNCINVLSTANADLPWTRPPTARASPAGLSIDPTGALGLAWADPSTMRVFHSSVNGSATRPLWWPDYRPMNVYLSTEGMPADLAALPPPTLLAVVPSGGPVEGNSLVAVHGVSLGRVRELRYVRENVWPSSSSAGLGLAFLPQCHAECPQNVEDLTYLERQWRAVIGSDGTDAARDESDEQCDNLSPKSQIYHSGENLNFAKWFQFRGAAGDRMRGTPPGKGRCGAEAAGWFNDTLPPAGAPPQRSKVCFAFGWSDCLWSVDALSCACSFDGGSSTIYTYRLRTPPGAPTCASYCGSSTKDAEYHSGPVVTSINDRSNASASHHGAHDFDVNEGAVDEEESALQDPDRQSIVRYMPGDARDLGAYLDFVSESRMYGRTPPVGKPRYVQLQVSADAGSTWYGGVTPAFGAQSYVALKYKFYATPSLSGLWPLAGPISISTNVTVSGSGFDAMPGLGTVICRFGRVLAPAFFRNSTHVLCSAPVRPRMAAGFQRFALTLNAQDYHETPSAHDAAGGFRYFTYSVRYSSIVNLSSVFLSFTPLDFA